MLREIIDNLLSTKLPPLQCYHIRGSELKAALPHRLQVKRQIQTLKIPAHREGYLVIPTTSRTPENEYNSQCAMAVHPWKQYNYTNISLRKSFQEPPDINESCVVTSPLFAAHPHKPCKVPLVQPAIEPARVSTTIKSKSPLRYHTNAMPGGPPAPRPSTNALTQSIHLPPPPMQTDRHRADLAENPDSVGGRTPKGTPSTSKARTWEYRDGKAEV
ncbi:hypothetical protein BT67DRAFT_65204 [Trichocladium antarcticum]|uniref:Uncharacterized protein n=1 Tax=Trichocladium antarcticum TaxID=1450529 RepID=A0AAN6UH55_9PEZI|nr:hypothetical protein BT67DRAFT_65204 [Trichocladium antarcticum]